MDSSTLRVIKRLTLIATLFSLIVIALGAYTRLVHAGLGCPDWPTCYGHFWAPDSVSEITSANIAFPDAPVNLDKTWPEMTHRYLASSLGLLCLIICLLGFNVKKTVPKFPFRHTVVLLVLVIIQGIFGMWTVTLKLWPQVVTLHLMGGFSTFGLLLLLHLRLTQPIKPVKATMIPKIRLLAFSVLVILFGQIMLGGWTSSNYAAMACLELPLCSIAQLSSQDFVQGFNLLQQIGPNYLGGQLDGGARIAIHAMHRFGALAVLVLSLMLITTLYQNRYVKLALALATMLIIQLLLGLSNVYFGLPLYNAVAHNIGGALLLATMIVINFTLYQQRKKRA